jgi:hypothetical protein
VPDRSEASTMFGFDGVFSSAEIGEDEARDGSVDDSGICRGRCISVSREMLSLENNLRL